MRAPENNPIVVMREVMGDETIGVTVDKTVITVEMIVITIEITIEITEIPVEMIGISVEMIRMIEGDIQVDMTGM